MSSRLAREHGARITRRRNCGVQPAGGVELLKFSTRAGKRPRRHACPDYLAVPFMAVFPVTMRSVAVREAVDCGGLLERPTIRIWSPILVVNCVM